MQREKGSWFSFFFLFIPVPLRSAPHHVKLHNGPDLNTKHSRPIAWEHCPRCANIHTLPHKIYSFCSTFFLKELFFWTFGFIDRTAEDLDRKQREGGSDTQQNDPGQESNPGPLQRGQSPCTGDTWSTNWAERHPLLESFWLLVFKIFFFF